MCFTPFARIRRDPLLSTRSTLARAREGEAIIVNRARRKREEIKAREKNRTDVKMGLSITHLKEHLKQAYMQMCIFTCVYVSIGREMRRRECNGSNPCNSLATNGESSTCVHKITIWILIRAEIRHFRYYLGGACDTEARRDLIRWRSKKRNTPAHCQANRWANKR